MTDKVILSNGSALAAKYGAAGAKKVRKAVQALIAAEGSTGLSLNAVFGGDGETQSVEEEESELRSDWQAEARPTKAVRAALGCTRRSLMPPT
jgi:hypothetical protein